MSGLGFTHWGALAAIAFGISFCTIDYASVQITPDGTLPNNSSVTREDIAFISLVKINLIVTTVLTKLLLLNQSKTEKL